MAGDTHGNESWVTLLAELAFIHGATRILQLGDFGLWPGWEGERFLAKSSESCRLMGVSLYAIDGNHDWHSRRLRLHEQLGWDQPLELAPSVFLLPRGFRWTWSGIRFGALGGAFSVDWRMRNPGSDWWPEEEITEEDVARLGGEPLDVLVTHDAPPGVPLAGWDLPPADQEKADLGRRMIGSAMAKTRPRLVLHGHWHHRHTLGLDSIQVTADGVHRLTARVEGLADDGAGDGRAWGILELPSLEFRGGTVVEALRSESDAEG